jgi:hypothetical protein
MGIIGISKSAMAVFGVGGLALALGVGGCSTEGTTASTSEPDTTTAPATVEAPANGSAALARLSNAQYDGAIRELLGVPEVSQASFPTDTAAGDHFEQYFDAADALGEQVFADPFLVSRLLSCTPNDADASCTRQIVSSFASKAWRGPMAPADVDRLTKVATDAIALGETPVNSIKQVVKTVLASPQFLYTVSTSTTL